MKPLKTIKVNRMTSDVARRLENFGFRIVWVRIATGFAIIGYK